MKILYFTDLHSRITRPAFRTDPNFLDTILKKVDEVVELSKGVDLLIFGGDLFHNFKPDYRLVNEIILRLRIIMLRKCETICVMGNHDIEGGNKETLINTALGTLWQAGIINVLTQVSRGNVVLKIIHYRIKPQLSDYVVDWPANTFRIIASHDMITPSKNFPFENISVDEVAEVCNANLVLCSHYHIPFHLHRKGIEFVNPGSLVRLDLTPGDVSRIPQIALITIDETQLSCEVELIPLKCAKPGQEVFDMKTKEEQKLKEKGIENFLEKLRELHGDVSDVSLEDKLRKLGKDLDIDDAVIEEAIRRLHLGEKELKSIE